MTEIYGLNYDFVQQNGHFIMMTGTEEQAINTGDLAPIQVNMLQENEIKGILPIDIEEIDFRVKFYYEITGRKILAHRLREEKLTMKQFYQLLTQVVAVLESSEEYMLSHINFILHPDFIFIEDDFKSIDLIYLPLELIDQKPTLKDELRELLFNLVGHVEELTGNGVQQLTQYLQDPSFNLKELKKMLENLDSDSLDQRKMTSSSLQKPALEPEPRSENESHAKIVQEKQANHSVDMAKPKAKPRVKKEQPKPPKKNAQKQEVDQEETEVKKPSLIVIACLAVFSLAIIWKLYDEMTSDSMFYVSVSLSLIVVAAAVYFAFIYEGKQSKTEENETSDKHLMKDLKSNIANLGKKNEKDKVPQIDDKEESTIDQPTLAANSVDSATYFEELQNQTTLLTQPNATVLLDEEQEGSADVAYLTVNRKGQTEKITLINSPFIIGRNAAAVDYMEDSVGISRTHIEIIENEESFFVKDLGSKNGTKKNDEPIVAYKSYQLNNNDRVTIGKVEYIFQKG